MQTVKEESYQAIFRKYYPRMFYYAKRIVGEDAADDVVQEAFLELWNRMDALETDVPQIESYLYKTIYSRGLNYLKRYKKVSILQPLKISTKCVCRAISLRWEMENRTWKTWS